MRIVKQLLGILATGYILAYYSEHLFWAHLRPEHSLSERISNWLVYSVLAYVFLSLLVRFRVFSVWALFLAGAIFGWLTEGLIVQTAYDSLPLSLSFTGLAWHALITIWVGFYAVPKVSLAGIRSILLLAAGIGLVYGFWAITWWMEPDGGMASPLDFALFSFTTTLLLIFAYWIYARTIPNVFKPSRIADVTITVLLLLYFIFVAIPKVQVAGLILPPLLFGIFLTLRHNKQAESRDSILESTAGVNKTWHYLGLLALPVTATIIYTAAFSLGLRWHTNWIVYLLTTPAGFILLTVSIIKVWRMKPAMALTY
jgi:hypothetical protein